MDAIEVSVVFPCLNEQESIGGCIQKAFSVIKESGLSGEVIVSDNGSTDNSIEIARSLGAKVVQQPEKGYGNAYLKGFAEAKGAFVVMADSDSTYDISEMGALIEKLKSGYDMVIGSRFKGKILKGAMPWPNRYIGNPILTGFLNIFFNSKVSDAHSGFRAMTQDALKRLKLNTGGMEFASEMVIKAIKAKLKMAEVPITYYPRQGKSKLNPFPDAWRHMRFMLLYSPNYLFLIPGGFLFILGLLVLLLSGWQKLVLFGHRFDIHAMVFSSAFCLLGFQIINLGLYAKTYALLAGFEEKDPLLQKFYAKFNLEKGLILGALVFLLGFSGLIAIFYRWVSEGFGPLNEVRLALFSLTFMVMGIQTIFSSFFLSLLGIERKR